MMKSWCPEIEPQAAEQIKNVVALPWVRHVAVMPDAHFGMGCTVGSVIAMKDALAPSTVGVDIGCGMLAAKLGIPDEGKRNLLENLPKLRHSFERSVPVGFNSHQVPWMEKDVAPENVFLQKEVQSLMAEGLNLNRPLSTAVLLKATHQVGTLGGGNHFIELSLDTKGGVWLVLHSGSRNIGNELAKFHIGVAGKLIHNEALPDKDLAVFLAGTPEMEAYRHDLYWAQRFAALNRQVMFRLLLKDVFHANDQKMPVTIDEFVSCHHNYVSEENHFGEDLYVTRKGAISAQWGEMGIIPGSMGTKSYIVKGLGNPESMTSASHGAGRRMSRGQARRTVTLDDFAKQTEGVECRKDSGVLDEAPAAYKSIDEVMANQKDLVEIVHELKAVLCCKG